MYRARLSTMHTLAPYNAIRYTRPREDLDGHSATQTSRSTMIVSFKDHGTRDVFLSNDSRRARNTCPSILWLAARDRLDQIHAATRLPQLRMPPGNHLEALRGDRLGQFSIRINRQFRVCFRWVGGHAEDVEIVDYH